MRTSAAECACGAGPFEPPLHGGAFSFSEQAFAHARLSLLIAGLYWTISAPIASKVTRRIAPLGCAPCEQ